MANELLKFRKGLYADLNNVAKDPGTIYVTTDEQAMYVDIDKDTRIRLGETVHFATLTDFQDFLKGTKPPYNPQAFYYIDAENALLKWVPNNGTYNPDVDGDGTGDSNGKWKQINSTAALTAEISSIKNDNDNEHNFFVRTYTNWAPHDKATIPEYVDLQRGKELLSEFKPKDVKEDTKVYKFEKEDTMSQNNLLNNTNTTKNNVINPASDKNNIPVINSTIVYLLDISSLQYLHFLPDNK